MADIDFYTDLNDDNPEDGFGLDDSLDGEDGYGTDDKLTPLQKLEKYMQSDNVYTRQMVARGLLDTLRAVENTTDRECVAVLNAMVRLSEDSDPIVRSELMEQVPHIAVYCHEHAIVFQNSVPLYVLPMVVRYLNDHHNQVRKTSQAALLVLLEQELIVKADIEQQVVSVILDLASPDSLDDYRTEAVALMSKMAPLLGKEMTERVFLPRYCEMCTDPLFHVRKVCAANFGDFCTVVGQENTEQQLLPKFYYLCEDGVWGVRKACAECFMEVSCACSPDVRRGELSTLFVNLLCDLSRWVRMAAFQQLGPFISTFADPGVTGLYFDDEGILCIKNPEVLLSLESGERLQNIVGQMDKDDMLVSPPEYDANTDANVKEEIDEKRLGVDIVCDNDNAGEPMEISTIDNESDRDSILKSETSDTPDISPEELRAKCYKDAEKSASPDVDSEVREAVEGSELSETNKCEPRCDSEEQVSASGQQQVKEESKNNSEDILSNSATEKDNSSAGSEDVVHIHLDNVVTNFNSFQYWRTPLPEIDLDFDIVNGAATNFQVTTKVREDKMYSMSGPQDSSTTNNTSNSNTRASSDRLSDTLNWLQLAEDKGPSQSVIEEGVKFHTASVNTVCDETVDNIGSTHVLGEHLNETTSKIVDGVVKDISGSSLSDNAEMDEAQLAQQQDIVPQSLLESYLGMADPSRAQTVDTEITRHCAYNLPAVAYTLGRKNWNCIKMLYDVLATDMQWKVRRTLAFSIHEMALILGEEITHRDLVPVFDGFLKDLDEVRIGVLKHLADFLRLLKPDMRQQYLTKVECFMNTDNCRNWRFRLELADQLMLMSELFSADEVSRYLLPLGITLAEDKVAEVRQAAFRLLSIMMKRMADRNDEKLTIGLVKALKEKFAESNKWARRQVYAQLIEYVLEEDAVPIEIFTTELVPSLLSLCHDAVPNVRISVAKTMSRHIFTREYFTSPKNPLYEEMCRTLQNLQSDSDRDVRFFACPQQDTCVDNEEDFNPDYIQANNFAQDDETLPV
ncbi:serine/threonine-protein phosphatase 4 regulatory subunit 1-like isoform X2 [Mizuhopecten yessoensis]|uniref:serine/threonine-protein phosphatase 4 regulatory subunit 1-like isoform X2 n=1 Tax=Mizuhopecten yessoensis TaxID=6573 RepID=UPI000B45D5AB|nr:serine/threonine-protein phosphatase 4 regulatory subunit 1-like isoform X2 [Mizuhopecten yessoensis]